MTSGDKSTFEQLFALAGELVKECPAEQPVWHAVHDSMNLDDVEANGYDICKWRVAQRAREALGEDA